MTWAIYYLILFIMPSQSLRNEQRGAAPPTCLIGNENLSAEVVPSFVSEQVFKSCKDKVGYASERSMLHDRFSAQICRKRSIAMIFFVWWVIS